MAEEKGYWCPHCEEFVEDVTTADTHIACGTPCSWTEIAANILAAKGQKPT